MTVSTSTDNPCPADVVLDDPALLDRFLANADVDAFAAIVRRYHGLVYSVCRRVVGQVADAEDAYQATFLVLAGRPRSLTQCRSLSGWLYGVAWRTSLRLIRRKKRHAMSTVTHEVPGREPDPPDVIAEQNRIAVLDEELNRLPEKYRDVLVMVYFAGRTGQQIAEELSETKGAIDGRIRDARNALRVRLARRGIELGVLTVAASLISKTAEAAAPELIDATVASGCQVLQQPAGCPAAPPILRSIIQPEFTMFGVKLLFVSGAGIAMLAAALSWVGWNAGHPGQPPVVDSSSPESIPDTVANATSQVSESRAAEPDTSTAPARDYRPESAEPFAAASMSAGQVGTSAALFRNAAKESRAATNRILTTLDETTLTLEYPGETPLSDLVGNIASRVLDETGLRLNIMLDYRELEPDNITSLDDILVRDLVLSEVTATVALEMALRQTDPELDYTVKDGVLMISTAEACRREENLMTIRYDISGLLHSTPDWVADRDQIADAVQGLTSPPFEWFVLDQRGGLIEVIGNQLLVRQSRRGHRAVADVLEQLEESVSRQ